MSEFTALLLAYALVFLIVLIFAGPAIMLIRMCFKQDPEKSFIISNDLLIGTFAGIISAYLLTLQGNFNWVELIIAIAGLIALYALSLSFMSFFQSKRTCKTPMKEVPFICSKCNGRRHIPYSQDWQNHQSFRKE